MSEFESRGKETKLCKACRESMRGANRARRAGYPRQRVTTRVIESDMKIGNPPTFENEDHKKLWHQWFRECIESGNPGYYGISD